MKNKYILSMVVLVLLSGCQKTEEKDQLVKEIETQKANAVGYIPDAPKIVKRASYDYRSLNIKSPFSDTVSKIKIKKKKETGVKPDLTREKGILEMQPLSNFYMTGVISSQKDTELQAIVKSSRGKVHLISVGDYIGRENGKIKEITETEIKLEEIVANGQSWVLRPASISIIGD